MYEGDWIETYEDRRRKEEELHASQREAWKLLTDADLDRMAETREERLQLEHDRAYWKWCGE